MFSRKNENEELIKSRLITKEELNRMKSAGFI